MERITVEAQEDFLERLAVASRPAAALSELIWNALDADATRVQVILRRTLLTAVDSVVIADNGEGMSRSEALEAFSRLGGSWKRGREKTRHQNRLLHGKDGKGRFRAFGLGARVEWVSVASPFDTHERLTISGSADDLKHFDISEVESTTDPKGTKVTITEIWPELPELADKRVHEELSETFAPYLQQYHAVSIEHDEMSLDPESGQHLTETYALGRVELEDETVTDGELQIIEWSRPTSRSLYLCDDGGFSLSRVTPQIQAPGYHFTAYLRSSYLRKKAESLSLGELHPGVASLIVKAKDLLRDHFRKRSAEQVRETVESWRSSEIYPYEGEPKTTIEVAERQVFDVVAYNVASYLPSFAAAEKQNQQLSFRLLKQAIEENPESLRRILADVLHLPKEQQDELASLLDRTSLSAVITAAKEVADRLDFLRGLELLVFEPTTKKQLLERSQLHRVLASATWLFGEEMRLAVDDQSLTEVLHRHLESLRRDSDESTRDNIPRVELAPVLREGGSIGIVDLMLSKRIPQSRAEKREHLVVELKRPTQAINPAVAAQIRSYAFAVQRDDRFRDAGASWSFWALSNRITDQVRWEMDDADKGILKSDDRNSLTIYLKTWGEVIDECRGRLNFFQERLQYTPSNEDAIRYLKEVHDKYIPASVGGSAASDSPYAPEELSQ